MTTQYDNPGYVIIYNNQVVSRQQTELLRLANPITVQSYVSIAWSAGFVCWFRYGKYLKKAKRPLFSVPSICKSRSNVTVPCPWRAEKTAPAHYWPPFLCLILSLVTLPYLARSNQLLAHPDWLPEDDPMRHLSRHPSDYCAGYH